MNILDIILLSVALAMDCFTVSIVCGVILRGSQEALSPHPQDYERDTIIRTSFLFGLFQAAMPLIGWLCTSHFSHYIEAYNHWIAFAMLAFIGIKMIRESFLPEEEHSFNPRRLRTQLLLAVATSIDALAVGISFAMTGYDRLSSLAWPLLSIGIGSFGFGLLGHWLGIHFGNTVSRRMKPELIGGIILLLIGIKILIA